MFWDKTMESFAPKKKTMESIVHLTTLQNIKINKDAFIILFLIIKAKEIYIPSKVVTERLLRS